MATTFIEAAGVVRTAQGYAVDPSNVIILPEISGRAEASSVTELAQSIKTGGQLQPALIWKNREGWPVLAAGHRRLRAIVEINKNLADGEEKRRLLFHTILAKNESEAFLFTLRENRDKLTPSPIDDGTNCLILRNKFGRSDEEIAEIFFPGPRNAEEAAKNVRTIRNWMSLLDLSPEAQEEYRSGFLGTTAAIQLSKLSSEVEQNKVITQAKQNGAKKIKVADVAKAAKKRTVQPDLDKRDATSRIKSRLEALVELAENAAILAMGCLADDREESLILDFSRMVLADARKLDIALPAEAGKVYA